MRQTMTEHQLKQSCTVAAENARSNCSTSVTCVRDTKVLVMLVPILAPITIGMAVLTLRPPAATNDTITEVHVEELCTKTVKRIPIISPTIGLDMMSLENIFPVKMMLG